MVSAMGSALRYIYGLILTVEAVVLTVVYALWMPGASTPIGLWLGTLGLLSMILMLVYSIARRSRALRRMARLSYWLHFHIFLGLQGALFVFFHCLPLLARAQLQLLNPGLLNAAAVSIVVGSGLFGRYLYAQMPKTLGGQHLERKELDAALAERIEVPDEIRKLWTDLPDNIGLFGLFGADRERRRAMGVVRKAGLPADTRDKALRRLQLERQSAVLKTAQRAFHSWIFLHRPLAAAMYLLSVVHILMALMFAPHLSFW